MNTKDAETLVSQFDTLFAGRRDVWGAVYGECRRERLTRRLWYGHLFGGGSVGVYPLVNGKVCWGCSDIDAGFDAIGAAANLWGALRELGLYAFVEKTKGKGYHVWVFCADWLPAESMRRAFLVAHDIVGVKATEVNPKQIGDTPKGLGNYVNTPYAKDWVMQDRRVVLEMNSDNRHPMSAHLFACKALSFRNSCAEVEKVAGLYKPPPPPERHAPSAGGAVLRGRTKTLFENGPTEGRDRSSTLFLLVRWLEVDGFTADEALPLLRDLDSRLQKYANRHDAEQRYAEIIDTVYSS